MSKEHLLNRLSLLNDQKKYLKKKLKETYNEIKLLKQHLQQLEAKASPANQHSTSPQSRLQRTSSSDDDLLREIDDLLRENNLPRSDGSPGEAASPANLQSKAASPANLPQSPQSRLQRTSSSDDDLLREIDDLLRENNLPRSDGSPGEAASPANLQSKAASPANLPQSPQSRLQRTSSSDDDLLSQASFYALSHSK